MSIETNGQAARAADEAVRSYREQIGDITRERSVIQGQIVEVNAQLSGLYTGFVDLFLPTVTEDTITRAAMQFGAVRLRGVFEEGNKDLAAQRERRDRAMANPEFADAAARLDALSAEAARLDAQKLALEAELTRFRNNSDFMELQADRAAASNPPVPAEGLEVLWSALVWYLFFGWYFQPAAAERFKRECARRDERILDAFEHSVLAALTERYDELPSKIDATKKAAAKARADAARITKVVDQHTSAVSEIDRLDLQVPQRVRDALWAHLGSLAPSAWAEQRASLVAMQPSFGLTLSTIIALKEKVRMLEGMMLYLSEQIRDREVRKSQIERLLIGWRRAPSYGRVRKDPTPFVVDAPSQMRRITTARVAGVHTMSNAVYGFNHYPVYDTYLTSNPYIDWMIWDMMVGCHHGHFPGDAFCHVVLPSVSEFHEGHPDASGAILDSIPAELLPAADPVFDGLDAMPDAHNGGVEGTPSFDEAAAASYDDPATFEDPSVALPDSTWSDGGGYSGGSSGGYDGGGYSSPSCDHGSSSSSGSWGGSDSSSSSSSWGGSDSSSSSSYDSGGSSGGDSGGGCGGGD